MRWRNGRGRAVKRMIGNDRDGRGMRRGTWRRRGGGAVFRRRRPVVAATAAAGRLRAGDTQPRQGEVAVSAAGTTAAREGAAAVSAAEAAVGLLP